MAAQHSINTRSYTDAQIANLPSLEASEDTFTRISDYDDSVSGILRPVPNTLSVVRELLAFNPLGSVANTTTETTLLTSTYTYSANKWQAGTMLVLRLGGLITNANDQGADTTTVRVSMGALDLATIPFAVPQSTSAGDQFWSAELAWWYLTFGSTYPIGSWRAVLTDEGAATGSTYSGRVPLTAVNLATATTLDVTAQHTVADTDTKISLFLGQLETAYET